ncbi:DUF5060 domain-containing protein [Rhodocytophaga aerolata]|uniref:DUF5060 domain-containing protein n=1 Tax=Rhodocytophaga aerolata TaxID=455078 RepID=A0ABT8RFA2_9BACT|nr:DUF5060 domain-containing protein [Rhodocytophaga aerolata]MDO1449848.1 DUF5060 domain-containing protein [Rhodocytophaga aerolata]
MSQTEKTKDMKVLTLLLVIITLLGCQNDNKLVEVEQWTTHEIRFESEKKYPNGYTDIDVWVQFVNDQGDSLLRPAFWDGNQVWKVRFTPPDFGHRWSWVSYASVDDSGLAGKTGTLHSIPYKANNNLLKRGLLKMSPGKRNVMHADGTPFLIVADTPWSIPFRAIPQQVMVYANDRRQKGFNTALLLSLQPDKFAKGPQARNTVLGFGRAFEDLHEGALNNLKPDYFQTLDSLVDILIDHELVPVYAPFAHGYGWKGETAIGTEAESDQYVRYCKYLLARYGSMPALWLINLDGHPLHAKGVKPAGEALEKWDSYQQPVGLHYSPYDDYLASWAKGDSSCCFHYNRIYQQEPWLDFQWAQTGHEGKHLFHKVERMYEEKPTKASMNGESTYEAMGEGKLGLGWWQGHDAWKQLMHGGTMGVVYGAASLWQWKITADEPGWPEWTNAAFSWREALDLEGSKYVAYIAKAFQGFDFADMEKRWDLTQGNQPLLSKEGTFYISYLERGGEIIIKNVPVGLSYYWFDPRTGQFSYKAKTNAGGMFTAPDPNPWVLVIGERSFE